MQHKYYGHYIAKTNAQNLLKIYTQLAPNIN